nr:MAG TPA: hypothetical protein [Caudoviricetes sp.]
MLFGSLGNRTQGQVYSIASCNDPCVSTDVTPLTMLRKEVD